MTENSKRHDEDTCAVCGSVIHPGPETTAHWDGPTGVTIVAWTDSRACTLAFEGRGK